MSRFFGRGSTWRLRLDVTLHMATLLHSIVVHEMSGNNERLLEAEMREESRVLQPHIFNSPRLCLLSR
jgi:hypothetical protein